MGGKWVNRRPPPSEFVACTRCGRRRRVNLGRARKKMSTGLCRDCYDVFEWQCPVCSDLMVWSYRTHHMKLKHPEVNHA